MENKAQKQQNGNDKNAIDSTSKVIEKNDIFISYRHLSKEDHDYRHSTSLARSLAQEFERKGYSVYFDCWDDPNKCFEVLKNSDYFIILVTKYSFDTNEKGGGFFKKELQRIKEITDKTENKKNNVFLLEVDNAYQNKNSDLMYALQKFAKTDLTGTIEQLLTDRKFSIDQLIKKPEHKGEKRIGKPSKLSTEKRFKRYRLAFFFTFFVLSIVSVLLGTNNEKVKEQGSIIREKDSIIKQYKNKDFIVFAGGRTVQQYIAQKYHVNVDQYNEPNAIYFHQPSTTATQFLWDDVNEDDPRKLCPIVLSATEIDTNNANTNELKSKGRRIAAYLVDNTPLKVQVFNHHGSKIETKPITTEKLRKLLMEENTTIWTTTKGSGTYLEYKKLLDIKGVFNLDDIVNNQKDGRHDFDLVKHIDFSNKTQQHIFLANDNYYYQKDNPDDSCSIVTHNSATATIPLYVYTIATVNSTKQIVELLPRAKEFLNKIGCDTEKPIGIHNSIIATWPQNKHFNPRISPSK